MEGEDRNTGEMWPVTHTQKTFSQGEDDILKFNFLLIFPEACVTRAFQRSHSGIPRSHLEWPLSQAGMGTVLGQTNDDTHHWDCERGIPSTPYFSVCPGEIISQVLYVLKQ